MIEEITREQTVSASSDKNEQDYRNSNIIQVWLFSFGATVVHFARE